MEFRDKTVLVFGATGQQGGSVANALQSKGWRVKALVRDPNTDKSEAIAAQGIELVRGDLTDVPSIQAAMAGTYGVFSVQPSSGQGAASGVTDEAEIRMEKRSLILQSRVAFIILFIVLQTPPGQPRPESDIVIPKVRSRSIFAV